MTKKKITPNWTYRKRAVWLSLIYCMSIIGYLLVFGEANSALQNTVGTNMLITMLALVAGYVFGKTLDAGNHGDEYDEDQGPEKPTDARGVATKLGSWKQRRKMIFVCLFFCTVTISYVTILGEDTPLNSSLGGGLCLLYAALLNSYIFGITLDKNLIKKR